MVERLLRRSSRSSDMLLVEGSPRNNMAAWVIEAMERGVAGAVLNPFTTPVASSPGVPSARSIADRLQDADADIWFDPMTHALQMSGVGDFRYYEQWDLWSGERGDMSTRGEQREHVQRVFDIQDELGSPHLAPTILLHTPVSSTSERMLELASVAVDLDPQCHLAIAGSATFWGAGDELDAHVASLLQLQPGGWRLTVGRPLAVLPVSAQPDEIFGLCRTVLALSEYAPVRIGYGDFAALPAVAAGATEIGTGWDIRQRVCAYPHFAERDEEAADGGSWFQRPTLQYLFGLLPRREAELLANQEPVLAGRVIPDELPPDSPKEVFLDHAEKLAELVSDLASRDPHDAYQVLDSAYETATDDWATTEATTACQDGADEWIGGLRDGLARLADDEGWT